MWAPGNPRAVELATTVLCSGAQVSSPEGPRLFPCCLQLDSPVQPGHRGVPGLFWLLCVSASFSRATFCGEPTGFWGSSGVWGGPAPCCLPSHLCLNGPASEGPPRPFLGHPATARSLWTAPSRAPVPSSALTWTDGCPDASFCHSRIVLPLCPSPVTWGVTRSSSIHSVAFTVTNLQPSHMSCHTPT